MNTEQERLNQNIKERRNSMITKIKLEVQKNQGIKRINLETPKMCINTKQTTSFNKEISEHQESSEFSSSNKAINSQDFIDYFDEKYILQDKIGQGGNGPVFKCQNKQSSIIFAVKYVRIDEQKKSELKKHFIFMKNLTHENIMKYKALYINEKRRLAYLITEYLPFKGLDEVEIENQEEFKIIVYQLLNVIRYIHQKNICHRDIKPENILYDKQKKQVKLIDFGNAKKTYSRGERRDMLTVNGTYLFLAPQVFTGGGYNQKVDLWALGATIFKLASGRYPFESEYVGETVEKIKNGAYTFKESEWQRWSPNIKSFVEGLLKKVHERMSITESLEHSWLRVNCFDKKDQPKVQVQEEEEKQNTPHRRKLRHSISYQPQDFRFDYDISFSKIKIEAKKNNSLTNYQDSQKPSRIKRFSIDSHISENASMAEIKEETIKELNAKARSDDGSFDADSDDSERQNQSPKKLTFPKRLQYVTSSNYQFMEEEELICYTPPVYSSQNKIENSTCPTLKSNQPSFEQVEGFWT